MKEDEMKIIARFQCGNKEKEKNILGQKTVCGRCRLKRKNIEHLIEGVQRKECVVQTQVSGRAGCGSEKVESVIKMKE